MIIAFTLKNYGSKTWSHGIFKCFKFQQKICVFHLKDGLRMLQMFSCICCLLLRECCPTHRPSCWAEEIAKRKFTVLQKCNDATYCWPELHEKMTCNVWWLGANWQALRVLTDIQMQYMWGILSQNPGIAHHAIFFAEVPFYGHTSLLICWTWQQPLIGTICSKRPNSFHLYFYLNFHV